MKYSISAGVKEILSTVLGLILAYSLALYLVAYLLTWNFVVGGLVAVLFYGYLIRSAIKQIRSPESAKYSILMASRIFLLLALIMVNLFSLISLVLATYGWAKYEPEGDELYIFFEYYFWTFLEVLPGLEVSETFGVKLPVEPRGLGAGLTVVVFRICMIFGIIGSFKVWWSARRKKKEGVNPK